MESTARLGRSATPPIDEAVTLLARQSPTRIAEIRARFPEASKILREGITAGPADDRQIQARVETCIAALESAEQQCVDYIGVFKKGLLAARRVALLGRVMTVLGSASVLASLAKVFPISAAVIGGVVSLVGALAPIVTEYLRGTIDDAQGGLPGRFREFIELATKARLLHDELVRWRGASMDTMPTEVIGQANAACAKINELVLSS
jgi:hypothetical protein